jgi:hypothetical protein
MGFWSVLLFSQCHSHTHTHTITNIHATDPQFVSECVRAAINGAPRGSPSRAYVAALREAVYRGCREATQFKPSLAAAVVRQFNARRVLDFSSGWGDRLAGCVAAKVDLYQGFDPNLSLTEGHGALLRACVPDPDRARFQITYEPFETAAIAQAPGTFDLLFTSPPFFDFEVYTALPGQSVQSFSTFPTWTVRFLLVALRKALAMVRVGGHAVIHITDVYKTRVCEPMCLLGRWILAGLLDFWFWVLFF